MSRTQSETLSPDCDTDMEAKSQPSDQIAIVGIGCRYGNGVDSVTQFWQMLVKGLDCTTPLPPDRFDVSYFLSPGEKTAGKMYIPNGGYIKQNPYMFDRQFFKMPPGKVTQFTKNMDISTHFLQKHAVTLSIS